MRHRSAVVLCALGLLLSPVLPAASAASAAPIAPAAGPAPIAPAAGPAPIAPAAGPAPATTRPSAPAAGPVVEMPPHVDPAPPGTRLGRRPSTAQLRRGTARTRTSRPAFLEPRAGSCAGTGTDGKRVHVLYAYPEGQASRYADVLPVLQEELAVVDRVFADSAAKTGGHRSVRWVYDRSTCAPVVTAVRLPSGAFDTFSATRSALARQGYTDPARKYLVFADVARLCGIGQTWLDDSPVENANDGDAYTSYARVDTPCWRTRGGESVPAHELMHALGAIQFSAPNSNGHGHCSDEHDLMCYEDGSGVPLRQVCPPSQNALFDCGNDDYFSARVAAGSYLATHWNTADSSFLDRSGAAVTSPQARAVAMEGPASGRAGLPVTLRVHGPSPEGWTWRADADCLLDNPDRDAVTVQCPTTTAGPVTVQVSGHDVTGQVLRGEHVLTLEGEPLQLSPRLTVAGPTTVRAGTSVRLRAHLRHQGQPVRGRVDVYAEAGGRRTLLRRGVDLGADGSAVLSARPRRSTVYRLVVRVTPGSGWAAPPARRATVRVR